MSVHSSDYTRQAVRLDHIVVLFILVDVPVGLSDDMADRCRVVFLTMQPNDKMRDRRPI